MALRSKWEPDALARSRINASFSLQRGDPQYQGDRTIEIGDGKAIQPGPGEVRLELVDEFLAVGDFVPDESLERTQLAAMTVVTQLIVNLDHFVMYGNTMNDVSKSWTHLLFLWKPSRKNRWQILVNGSYSVCQPGAKMRAKITALDLLRTTRPWRAVSIPRKRKVFWPQLDSPGLP